MASLTVNQTVRLQGQTTIPSSKSQNIRGMIFALLADGESVLENVLASEDTHATLTVINALGAQIEIINNTAIVKSNGFPLKPIATEINTGNSGITTLFTLPLLGLRDECEQSIVLNCGEQMRNRPIQPLIDALCQLGMRIEPIHEKNKLPISVTGQLQGGVTDIDGIHSQYLSALLIALPYAKNNSVITVKNLHERPYVNMTLDFLKAQKIHYTHEQKNQCDIFHIQGNQRYYPMQRLIKGDFSSASCLIAASVLIPSCVELQGLDCEDSQGDKKLIPLLQAMGAAITIEKNSIKITDYKPLTGICIDAGDIPDLVPALAVIGTQASGKTEIVNVKQARIKECDRIQSMTEGLRRMGAKIEEYDDGMTIYQSPLTGTEVEGYHDHRTVMALSIAGMIAEGKTTITNQEAINKTYPGFVHALKSLGASISIDDTDVHIILIGFKHVGKTYIGERLAKKNNKPFIDLDREIEKSYLHQNGTSLECRQIMQLHGELYFRKLESETLSKVIKLQSCVIALGGGTPLEISNQPLIKPHRIIHVIAPREVVFERIMAGGIPAFFDPNEDPYTFFNRLWDKREKVYKQLAEFTINNNQ